MADQPDLSGVPTLHSFFEAPELYERYHIHLIGVRPTAKTLEGGGKGGIGKRRNLFGTPRIIDAISDPYVTLCTVGPDTGSTEYFAIGSHTFPVLVDSQTPLWDAKCLLIAKKDSTEGIEFKMLDKSFMAPHRDSTGEGVMEFEKDAAKDECLLGFTLLRSEMPEITPTRDSEWTEYVRSSEVERAAGMDFVFRVMVTDCADRSVSKEEMDDMYQDTDQMTYTEEVIPDNTTDPEDNSLLQCWRQSTNEANKAVLWILGRNDTFMHPHVAKKLFFCSNFDLYVLNYKMNGHCCKHGWVSDAHFNSHNKYGSFDTYISDIEKSIELISTFKEYDTFLGYAHSTGGPVLINYLIERGDGDFDGFIFNSPFLDWGFVGGDMIEFSLKHMGALKMIAKDSNDTKMGVAVTPEALKDSPITYLEEEIVLSDWSARIWSLYYFDWGTRPLYKVPMTVGFAKGVTEVHRKLEEMHSSKRAVTAKPFLCITSRGDDVLKAPETLSRADWIGPTRWEVELNDNGHDVFLSQDESDTNMAIDMVATWMKYKRFS